MSPVAKVARVPVGVEFDDASVSALQMAGVLLEASVVRSADIRQCAPDRLRNADLIVFTIAADDGAHAQFDATVQVLKECVHPVLFVPSADGMYERSSS